MDALMREFLLEHRRALKMEIAWIERTLEQDEPVPTASNGGGRYRPANPPKSLIARPVVTKRDE